MTAVCLRASLRALVIKQGCTMSGGLIPTHNHPGETKPTFFCRTQKNVVIFMFTPLSQINVHPVHCTVSSGGSGGGVKLQQGTFVDQICVKVAGRLI